MLKPPAVVAACVALLLVASACTDDSPEPNYSSVSTSPSASASSSSPSPSGSDTANVPSGATEPTLPSNAQVDETDGAFAFVGYYWKRVDWAYSTVDGKALDGLYRSTCASCESSRKSIDDVRAKGHSLRGGHVAIQSQRLADPADDPTATYAIDTSLTVEALTEVAADGTEVASPDLS